MRREYTRRQISEAIEYWSNVLRYQPPWSLKDLRRKLPTKKYLELKYDPVHSWRARTGIELVHREPDEEELDRIWSNWQLMPKELKAKSDQMSMRLFGMPNRQHYFMLKEEWQSKQR